MWWLIGWWEAAVHACDGFQAALRGDDKDDRRG